MNWAPRTFKYLGAQVFHDMADLQEGNLSRALRSLRVSVGFWRSLKLRIMSRIELSKMIMFPHLLYVFANLPLQIPSAWFRELNTLLRELIWDNGRKRTSLSTLCRPTHLGRLGAPDFESYYLASQLQWVAGWSAGRGQLDRCTTHEVIDTNRIIARMINRKIVLRMDRLMTRVAMSCWKRCAKRVGVGLPYSPALPSSVIALEPGGTFWGARDWDHGEGRSGHNRGTVP
ncbi:hypothetical protein NDU88_007263 [Pleurodeles waltl]|uniref:Reverse transcriptase n=1 Tax=Pleurodeles waltl TaxID=8319 RepID=A0AAV7VTB0_PLEWA|nr:hypothetical protein NDU88_007263 [Pleurodeles waltl]